MKTLATLLKGTGFLITAVVGIMVLTGFEDYEILFWIAQIGLIGFTYEYLINYFLVTEE